MQTIKDLDGSIQANARLARNLLAEKGSAQWSRADQSRFDNYLDNIEHAKDKIAAMSPADSADYSRIRSGLETYIRCNSGALTPELRARVQNAMSTTTGSQGGFTVQTSVAAELVSLLRGYGWMRQVASQFYTASGADLSVPTSDGTSEVGEVLAQNAAATSLDPSFGTAPINTCHVSSKVFTVPVELLRDSSIDIVSFIFMRARDRIGRKQNALFTTGTGTGEPTGLVTAASVGKTGTTGQTLTVIYDDLVDLAESVDEGHMGMPDTQPGMPQKTPGWMMSQTTRKVVRKLKDTAGRPIWMPACMDGKTAQPAMLLDHPVYLNNDMPAPAANAKSIAFGNLASYTIRDALDVRLLRFEDSAFALKGQVGFLGTARTGGNLLDSGAVKLYQHSAT